MINHNYFMLFISHYLMLHALASSTKSLSGSMRNSEKVCPVLYPSCNMQLRSQLYQLMYKMESKMNKIMQVISQNIMYFIDHINKL